MHFKGHAAEIKAGMKTYTSELTSEVLDRNVTPFRVAITVHYRTGLYKENLAGCGGTHQQLQHSPGGGRGIRNSTSSSVIEFHFLLFWMLGNPTLRSQYLVEVLCVCPRQKTNGPNLLF